MTEDVLAISAHKYGNYHKYYEFHPSNARTKVIMSVPRIFEHMWKAQGRPSMFSILDIGCNEGNLSMDILAAAKSQLPSHVKCILLGVDIDRHLIGLANAKYLSQSIDGSICFETVDVMDDASTTAFMDSYMAQHNMLPTSSSSTAAAAAASGDGSSGSDCGGFSFVCLFSITMWVHLNHGDAGLKNFLDVSTKYLAPRGNFLVEPQPWKCYKNAEKRTKRLGMDRPKYLSEITMKDIETVIPNYVMKNVPLMESYWCLGKEVWGRSIFIFHRNALPSLLNLAPVTAATTTADTAAGTTTTSTTSISASVSADSSSWADAVEGSSSSSSSLESASIVGGIAAATETDTNRGREDNTEQEHKKAKLT